MSETEPRFWDGLGPQLIVIAATLLLVLREISRKAVWDFFDSIDPMRTSDSIFHLRFRRCVRLPQAARVRDNRPDARAPKRS
jgi:hypothetical protein